MALTLDKAMKEAGLGDAALGAACAPPVHRTSIWAYRTGISIPRGDTASAVLVALNAARARKGLPPATIADLIRAKPRRRRAA